MCEDLSMNEAWLFLVVMLPGVFALVGIVGAKLWPDYFERETHALDGLQRLIDRVAKYLFISLWP